MKAKKIFYTELSRRDYCVDKIAWGKFLEKKRNESWVNFSWGNYSHRRNYLWGGGGFSWRLKVGILARLEINNFISSYNLSIDVCKL